MKIFIDGQEAEFTGDGLGEFWIRPKDKKWIHLSIFAEEGEELTFSKGNK